MEAFCTVSVGLQVSPAHTMDATLTGSRMLVARPHVTCGHCRRHIRSQRPQQLRSKTSVADSRCWGRRRAAAAPANTWGAGRRGSPRRGKPGSWHPQRLRAAALPLRSCSYDHPRSCGAAVCLTRRTQPECLTCLRFIGTSLWTVPAVRLEFQQIATQRDTSKPGSSSRAREPRSALPQTRRQARHQLGLASIAGANLSQHLCPFVIFIAIDAPQGGSCIL
jgi:hypothetical protein